MSKTPRTDAALLNLNYGEHPGSSGDGVTAYEAAYDALLSLCKQLETELAAAHLVRDANRIRAKMRRVMNATVQCIVWHGRKMKGEPQP